MSKEMSVIVLGIWVLIVPYLGVPSSWRTVLLVLSGLALAIVGFLLRGEALSRGASPRARRPNTSFIESEPVPPAPPEPEPQESRGIGSLN